MFFLFLIKTYIYILFIHLYSSSFLWITCPRCSSRQYHHDQSSYFLYHFYLKKKSPPLCNLLLNTSNDPCKHSTITNRLRQPSCYFFNFIIYITLTRWDSSRCVFFIFNKNVYISFLFIYILLLFSESPVLAAAPDSYIKSYVIHFSYHFIFPYRTNPPCSSVFYIKEKPYTSMFQSIYVHFYILHIALFFLMVSVCSCFVCFCITNPIYHFLYTFIAFFLLYLPVLAAAPDSKPSFSRISL